MALGSCARGVHRLRTLMANVYFVSDHAGGWTLVDAGLPGYGHVIRSTARRLFGSRPPSAIVLTHGHFDHIGALRTLSRAWRVPIYAHPLELPYLTGRSPYAPPDPTVGGGMWSMVSRLFPRGPVDLGEHVHMLPEGGVIPSLPAWRWIHTPGHTAGHISLFRDADRVLIAGDAVVTTRQESFASVMTQRRVISRPPAYYTSDWSAAHCSVERLSALRPEVLAAGHGSPLHGPVMREDLQRFARHFERQIPSRGRYVTEPAVADDEGLLYVPPPVGVDRSIVAGAAAMAVAAMAIVQLRPRSA